jgi:lysophospholipase L1-like esterase
MKLKSALLGAGWGLLFCLGAIAIAALLNPRVADSLLWRFESLERSPSVTQRAFELHMHKNNRYVEQSLQPGTPLFFGDSHLQRIPTENTRWAANFAVSGQPVKRMLESVQQFKSLETASIVFINGGENDLATGESIEQITGHWQALITGLQKAKKLVCVGVPEADSPRKRAEKVRQLNTAISDVCQKNGRPFLAVQMGVGAFKGEQMDSDNVHLTRSASNKLAELMKQMMN